MSQTEVAEASERVTALNMDVFRIVLHFCAVADVLRISYASRLLRKEAVQELLSRPVILYSTKQVESFCSLMLAGDSSLFSYLHTLVINRLLSLSPETTRKFIEVIGLATGLRKLYLRGCRALFATSDTRFADAVAQLERLTLLQVLVAKEMQRHVRVMVLRLRSRLQNLNIQEEPDNDFGRDFPDELAKCQPQLEKLRICYPSLSSRWTPFTSVRILTLSIGNQRIDLRCISETFPNVRELSISARVFEVDLRRPSEEITAARNAAIAWQNGGGGWKSLDYLFGTGGDLFTLCLTCPVRLVQLGQYERDLHQGYLDVISRTRPRRVDIKIYCCPWLQTPILATPSLFVYDTDSEGPGGAVSHMHLDISLSASETITTRLLIDTITPFLATSRLEYLHLEIGEFFFSKGDDYLLSVIPPVPQKLQETMTNIDIAELVSAVATSGPVLRTIVLSPVTRERTVWTVDRGDGRQVLRRLDPHAGSQIVEQEEGDV